MVGYTVDWWIIKVTDINFTPCLLSIEQNLPLSLIIVQSQKKIKLCNLRRVEGKNKTSGQRLSNKNRANVRLRSRGGLYMFRLDWQTEASNNQRNGISMLDFLLQDYHSLGQANTIYKQKTRNNSCIHLRWALSNCDQQLNYIQYYFDHPYINFTGFDYPNMKWSVCF